MESIESSRVLRAVTETARRYLGDDLGVEVAAVEAVPGKTAELVSFLRLKGPIPGTLILQAGPDAVRALLVRMTGGEYAPEEETVLLRETLNEVLNIVTGNATRDLACCGARVHLTPPFAARCDGRHAAALSTERLSSQNVLRTAAGDFLIAFAQPAAGPDETENP